MATNSMENVQLTFGQSENGTTNAALMMQMIGLPSGTWRRSTNFPTTMISLPDAFELFTISNVALAGPGLNPDTGLLHLRGVSVPHAGPDDGRHVYLVLRLNAFEMPIDPTCVVTRTDGPKARTYHFTGTQADPLEFTLSVAGPFAPGEDTADKLETLETILEEYISEFRYAGPGVVAVEPLTAGQTNAISGAVDGNRDLRGHLVMINEDTGEIIGEVEDRFRITEDATMQQKGHENDPVVIHVPDEYTRDSDKHALEVFATVIPPEQRNWISTSANIVSHAISMTTNLLITTISTGASLYVNHTAPSPHNPASGAATPTGSTARDKGAVPTAANTFGGAPPPPPRALQYLTSERTRKNLSTVHALSGQAVKVSTKTVGLIDEMIRRAMGAKPKRQKYFATGIPPSGSSSTLTPNADRKGQQYSRSPSPSPRLAPPPYNVGGNEKSGSSAYPLDKPALPPRRSPSPAPAPSWNSTISGSSATNGSGTPAPVPYEQCHPRGAQPLPPLPQRKLKTKDHILISADLILSTIDDSARRMLDAGTEQFGRVVGHKYGPEAKESSLYMAGTARNVGLVYIDVSGIGRRALLKRAGKTFLKARLSSNDPAAYPPPNAQTPLPTPRK